MQGICKPYAQERAHHAKRRAFQGEFVVDQMVLHVDVDRDRGKGQEKDQVDAARLHLLHPEEQGQIEHEDPAAAQPKRADKPRDQACDPRDQPPAHRRSSRTAA